MIQFIDPDITKQDAQIVYKQILSGFINEGSKTNELAKLFSKFIGAKYSVPTTNCTTAIAISIMALGIKNKEIIVPDLTMIGTAYAVLQSGNIPVIADVSKKNGLLTISELSRNVTKKTAAVILVNYTGRDALDKEITSFCSLKNIKIIEDCAGALGSISNKNKYLGTRGDFGCFSFASTKIAVSGQGGMLITNNKDLYLKAMKIKDWGRGLNKGMIHNDIGFNYKFNDILACLLINQIKRLDKLIIKKKNIYNYYRKNTENLIFSETSFSGYVPWYVEIKGINKIGILKKNKIGFSRLWPPLHMQKGLKNFVNKKQLYINSKFLYQSNLWLPSSTKLKKTELSFICEVLNI